MDRNIIFNRSHICWFILSGPQIFIFHDFIDLERNKEPSGNTCWEKNEHLILSNLISKGCQKKERPCLTKLSCFGVKPIDNWFVCCGCCYTFFRCVSISSKNLAVYGVYGTLFDRLELTISTQKSVLKKKYRVMRYCPKYVKIWAFCSKSQFLALIRRYLWTHCIFFKSDWCVETVSPSRSKRVSWAP